MREVWLRGNMRMLGLIAGIALVADLLAIALMIWGYAAPHWPIFLLGALGLAAVTALAIGIWTRHAARLAYRPGVLEVRLGQTEELPIEIVECFLIGRSPSFLPGEKHRRTETVTLVVRLRERATEFEHRELDPRLGTWCGHHITLRGTWCEPISVALAQRLNARLAEVQPSMAGRA